VTYAECFNLQLCIVQTLLNQAPDADKTDKLAVLNNRKMAEPSLRHDVHDLGHGVMAGTAANIPGHQVSDLLRQDVRAVSG
jgi:hypothetical protein